MPVDIEGIIDQHSTIAAGNCCAYLCAFCPCTSFRSMKLLEKHIRINHNPPDYNKDCLQFTDENDEEIKSGEKKSMVVSIEENMAPNINILEHITLAMGTPSSIAHSPNSTSSLSSGGQQLSIEPGKEQRLQQMVSEQAELTCKKCPGGRVFPSREQLDMHSSNTHRDKPQYVCSECNAIFTIKRELSTHQRVHFGEKLQQCEKCGKYFGTRQLLKKHTMWHTGERSHVCPRCGKKFFQKGHLTQHLMIHTGKRPHHCSLCEKTFIFKFDLNRHLKIHRERKFLCNKCGKCFVEQYFLDEHREKCKKESIRNSECKMHILTSGTVNLSKLSTEKNIKVNNVGQFVKKDEAIVGIDTEEEKISIESNEQKDSATMDPSINQSQLASQTLPHSVESSSPSTIADIIQMAFMSLMANQQHHGEFTRTTFPEQQQTLPCPYCPQKMINQIAYLIHIIKYHMQTETGDGSFTSETTAMYEQKSWPMLYPSVVTTLSQKNPRQLHSKISYISSTQNGSPICSFSSSIFSAEHPSHNIPLLPKSSVAFDAARSNKKQQHQHQLPFTSPIIASLLSPCPNCELERQLRAHSERELVEKKAELEQLKVLCMRLFIGTDNRDSATEALSLNAAPFLHHIDTIADHFVSQSN